MQRHRRLVPLRDLDRGGDVAGVPVGADHREDLALPGRASTRPRPRPGRSRSPRHHPRRATRCLGTAGVAGDSCPQPPGPTPARPDLHDRTSDPKRQPGRRPNAPWVTLIPVFGLGGEGQRGLGDELHRDRRQQQASDSGEQLHPVSVRTRWMTSANRIASQARPRRRRSPRERDPVHELWMRWTYSIVATIPPGPASSGVPSGTKATLVLARSVEVGSSVLPVSSWKATSRWRGRRPLEGRELDLRVLQDRPAEQRERDDHGERYRGRLPGEPPLRADRPAPGQPEVHWHGPRRIDDHEERDERLEEERHGLAPARASSRSYSSGGVVSTPRPRLLKDPWSSLPPVAIRPRDAAS